MGGAATDAGHQRRRDMDQAFAGAGTFEDGAENQENQDVVGDQPGDASEYAIEGIPDDLHEIAHVDAEMLENPRQPRAGKSEGNENESHDRQRPAPGPDGQQHQRRHAGQGRGNVHRRRHIETGPQLLLDLEEPVGGKKEGCDDQGIHGPGEKTNPPKGGQKCRRLRRQHDDRTDGNGAETGVGLVDDEKGDDGDDDEREKAGANSPESLNRKIVCRIGR